MLKYFNIWMVTSIKRYRIKMWVTLRLCGNRGLVSPHGGILYFLMNTSRSIFIGLNPWPAWDAQFCTVLRVLVIILVMACRHRSVIQMTMSSAYATILKAFSSLIRNDSVVTRKKKIIAIFNAVKTLVLSFLRPTSKLI